MKKYICILLLLVCTFAMCIAQEQENTWRGTARFNPADIFINLHNAFPGMYITWTPYVFPIGPQSNIGYQFVTKKGFVATPAAGVVYNGRSGFGLNLMFDLDAALDYEAGNKKLGSLQSRTWICFKCYIGSMG